MANITAYYIKCHVGYISDKAFMKLGFIFGLELGDVFLIHSAQ